MIEVAEAAPEDGSGERDIGGGRDPRAPPAERPPRHGEKGQDLKRAQERGKDGRDPQDLFRRRLAPEERRATLRPRRGRTREAR